jgi:hypothetical protein
VFEGAISRLSQIIKILILALIIETFAIVGAIALLTTGEDYVTESTETVEQAAEDSGVNTYVGGNYGSEAENYTNDQDS